MITDAVTGVILEGTELCRAQQTVLRYVPPAGYVDPSEPVQLIREFRECGLPEDHDGDHITIFNGRPLRWPQA